MDWKVSLEAWEGLLRSGQGHKVRDELAKLVLVKVPRMYSSQVANYFNRLNMPDQALRLLNPYVRPKDQDETPKGDEILEYAIGLIRVGALKESCYLLERGELEGRAQTSLYKAYYHMSMWNYRKASKDLNTYLLQENLEKYQQLTAKVNLAACLIRFKSFDQAHELLNYIVEDSEKSGHAVLLGNSHELLAQIYFRQEDFAKTIHHLDSAEKHLAKSNTIGHFFVKKWRTFLTAKKSTKDEEKRQLIDHLRKEAFQIGHYESMRSCDSFLLSEFREKYIYMHLVFGTPFEEMRSELREMASFDLPDTYVWRKLNTSFPSHFFSLKRGEDDRKQCQLKPAQVAHRLLMALSEDFYRPRSVARLFNDLFPDEYYNPITSPDRIHKATGRLRKWLMTEGLPLSIEEKNGQYRLTPGDDYGLEVQSKERFYNAGDVIEARLKSRFKGEVFNRLQASEVLRLKPESLLKALRPLIDEQKIFSQGKGQKQVFSFQKEQFLKLK